MLLRWALFISVAVMPNLISALLQQLGNPDRQQYCQLERKLCRGKKHVGCATDGQPSGNCRSEFEVIDLSPFEDYIVQRHNELRAQIANGKLPRYEQAANMFSVSWDPKLARTAFLNTLQCEMEHDGCRAEEEYPYAGQNLAIKWSMPYYPKDVKAFVEEMMMGWYNEHTDASMSDIRRYYYPTKMIGHFTQFVNAGVYTIGCAAVKFADQVTNRGWKTMLLACNYTITNIIDNEVYKVGRAASACPKGPDPKYTGLCAPVVGPSVLSAPSAPSAPSQMPATTASPTPTSPRAPRAPRTSRADAPQAPAAPQAPQVPQALRRRSTDSDASAVPTPSTRRRASSSDDSSSTPSARRRGSSSDDSVPAQSPRIRASRGSTPSPAAPAGPEFPSIWADDNRRNPAAPTTPLAYSPEEEKPTSNRRNRSNQASQQSNNPATFPYNPFSQIPGMNIGAFGDMESIIKKQMEAMMNSLGQNMNFNDPNSFTKVFHESFDDGVFGGKVTIRVRNF